MRGLFELTFVSNDGDDQGKMLFIKQCNSAFDMPSVYKWATDYALLAGAQNVKNDSTSLSFKCSVATWPIDKPETQDFYILHQQFGSK